jgi:Cof subfamily protein (haloacid dehalogenase superfamily)
MKTIPFNTPEEAIGPLIQGLESLQDGEGAERNLLSVGQSAVPHLADFLLHTRPRTIAEPRCRAVRVLAALGAYETLIAYFREGTLAADAQVLFAEDAVRSAVAHALLRWKTQETYDVLLHAAERRSTEGLLFAIGEFCRPETIPLLFRSLEDDLCREAALAALRKVPEQARTYAVQSLKDLTNVQVRGGNARWRCRATMKLLRELGVSAHDWQKIHGFLFEEDAGIVLNAAQIGSKIAPSTEHPAILQAVIRVADRFNGFEEQEATELFLSNGLLARKAASLAEQQRINRGEKPRWQLPSWRILRHVLDGCTKGGTMEPHETRLFVSDVDGTLLNAHKELTDATRKAIKRLRDAGILVSLISSRPARGLKWLIDELELQHACTALNGGVIIDPQLNVLSAYPLRPALAEEIHGLVESEGLWPWIYTESSWYVPNLDADHVRHETDVVRFEPLPFKTLAGLDGPIIKITGISDDHDTILAAQNLLANKFGEQMSLSCSLANRLEITHADANKGSAIEAIGATLNIAPEAIATAGDGENDILMFRKSGFSIAMGQAPAEVRRAATVTATTSSQDGLAWAIEEFLLKHRT